MFFADVKWLHQILCDIFNECLNSKKSCLDPLSSLISLSANIEHVKFDSIDTELSLKDSRSKHTTT